MGCESTFVTSNRREVLDINLSNERIIAQVSQWRVSSEPFMSDHRIIKFALKVELPKRIPSNIDWNIFRDTLGLNIKKLGS